MGIANAAVLPLPVGALPTTFFPSSIAGITCCWSGVEEEDEEEEGMEVEEVGLLEDEEEEAE